MRAQCALCCGCGETQSALRKAMCNFFQGENVAESVYCLKLLFSQTAPKTEGCNLKILPAIERNGYNFMDGRGHISKDLLVAIKARSLGQAVHRLSQEQMAQPSNLLRTIWIYRGSLPFSKHSRHSYHSRHSKHS